MIQDRRKIRAMNNKKSGCGCGKPKPEQKGK
jgi:hypothetical protein